MMAMATLDLRLGGHTAAFRDAEVTLVNEATGQQIRRKPFLDGSLLVRDLDPGNWEMAVTHPNLINPIDRRRIKLFPQPFPTRIPVEVPPALFRDTPIRDVPDADLAPVQQAAATAAGNAARLGVKAPGEVIRAEDWNVLAGAVADLARSVGELTRLVSPRGHDHPEIAEKIAEVQGNILRFSESFGQSLLELRREIESQSLRRRLTEVLDKGGAPTDTRERVFARLDDLQTVTLAPTAVWATTFASHANALVAETMDLADSQPDTQAFLATDEVRSAVTMLQNLSNASGTTRAEDEMRVYRINTAAVGPSIFGLRR